MNRGLFVLLLIGVAVYVMNSKTAKTAGDYKSPVTNEYGGEYYG